MNRPYIGGGPAVRAPVAFPRSAIARERAWAESLDPTEYVVASDVTTTLAGIAATPVAFTIPVLVGRTYLAEFWLWFTTAVSTTGYQIYIDGPASPTAVTYAFRGKTSTTTASQDFYQADGYLVGYDSGFAGAATGNNPCNGYVALVNGANAGNLVLAVRSEVSGSSISLKAGSFAKVTLLKDTR